VKKGLENIEEVFKQKFEGFEADVDPSVWNNIQNSITSGTGLESSVMPDSTITSIVGKSLVLKLVAGVLALSSIATGAYFLTDSSKVIDFEIASSNVVSDVIPKERESLSVERDLVEVAEAFEVIENQSKEEVLENVVSSEDYTEGVSLEIASSDVGQSVNSSQENEVAKEESEGSTTVAETIKEKNIKQVPEKTQHDIVADTKETLKGSILPSVIKGEAPLDVSFDVEGVGIVGYSWDFGDNSEVDNGESVFHTFENAGRYLVSLTISGQEKKSKIIHKYIDVEKSVTSTLGFLQNTFTPNGDGNNDVYVLKSAKNIKTFNAKVMNATTGKIIFVWNNIEEGWNGTDMSGRMMEDGSYALSIYAEGIDGEEHQKRQLITLIK
jgi:gliding motility-associated-like protein